MENLSVQVPEDWADTIDKLADKHDTSRAAVLRSAIDDGLRAHKYYPDEFAINPERYEYRNAPELAKSGDLRR